jgi:hypothetical protein
MGRAAAVPDKSAVQQRGNDMQIRDFAAALVLWANAKAAQMLIRNTSVQCAGKWKKKEK